MSLKGFEGIVESIKADAKLVSDTVIHDANAAGKKRYEAMMEESKQHLETQRIMYETEVRSTYQREMRRAEKEIQREIVSAKHDYVQRLLDACLKDLETMDDSKFLELLNTVLAKENGGDRPRIHVDSQRYPYVLNHIGSRFQIIEDASLQSGFVLSYVDYDIDFEFKNIFQYRHESFTKRILLDMFEADHDA